MSKEFRIKVTPDNDQAALLDFAELLDGAIEEYAGPLDIETNWRIQE